MIDQFHYLLAALSGGGVGFSLGLVGGGGSILAVPLMVYVVGVRNPHVAIGTSALAVAANALAGLASHAHHRNVNWRCGGTFAAAGVLGALAGSTLGKAVDGQKLLFLFALLMVVVAIAMYRGRGTEGSDSVVCNRDNLGKVLGFGFGTGALSGFFGIGGGFLIVPALAASTRMAVHRAIGTSLVAVSAFGLATAASYAFSGLIDWWLAAVFVGGGVAGSVIGTAVSRRLAQRKGGLHTLFAALILAVAIYMLARSGLALFG
jgi:uncharacterized membrane protein YfcA